MLKKVVVNSDELIGDASYIWGLGKSYEVVCADAAGKGIFFDKDLFLVFDDGFVGQLYEPIEFES